MSCGQIPDGGRDMDDYRPVPQEPRAAFDVVLRALAWTFWCVLIFGSVFVCWRALS